MCRKGIRMITYEQKIELLRNTYTSEQLAQFLLEEMDIGETLRRDIFELRIELKYARELNISYANILLQK